MAQVVSPAFPVAYASASAGNTLVTTVCPPQTNVAAAGSAALPHQSMWHSETSGTVGSPRTPCSKK